jgi:transketolase
MTVQTATRDMREAIVEELIRSSEAGVPVVVLVSDSTSTSAIGPFRARFPARLVNVGIAEQNLLGVAAGLSLGGFVSVTANAACFLVARSCEQLKNDVCYSATNVKLLGLSAGVAYGPLGGTHHAIDDISILRGMGTVRIFAPADAPEAAQVMRHALSTPGPVYIRMDSAALPVFHDARYEFVPGKIDPVAEGTDVTVFALGSLVSEALLARDRAAGAGVSVSVVNLSSVRPVDAESIASRAAATGRVITVEEHSLHGGIGSLVAESLAERGVGISLVRLGIPEGVFAKSGPRAEIRRHYGIDAQGIEQAVLRIVGREV